MLEEKKEKTLLELAFEEGFRREIIGANYLNSQDSPYGKAGAEAGKAVLSSLRSSERFASERSKLEKEYEDAHVAERPADSAVYAGIMIRARQNVFGSKFSDLEKLLKEVAPDHKMNLADGFEEMYMQVNKTATEKGEDALSDQEKEILNIGYTKKQITYTALLDKLGRGLVEKYASEKYNAQTAHLKRASEKAMGKGANIEQVPQRAEYAEAA